MAKKRKIIELIDVEKIRPIEGYGPKRVAWLKQKIESEQLWTQPLKIEKHRHLLMDGHHRHQVALRLGLRFVPAVLLDYRDVRVWSLRKRIEVTPEVILRNSHEEILFPYKTAKHEFPAWANAICEGIDLDALR